MTIAQGPGFGGPPVEQPTPEPGKWWHRDEHGILWVYCPPITATAQWHDAPVPMADLGASSSTEARTVEPSRITMALDSRGLDGPEVDEALGVADAFDTVVDSWEAGEAAPTLDEVRRLSTLTGYPVSFFYGGPIPKITHGFICGGRRGGGCRPIR